MAIFISYRRAGTAGYGGRLQEDLRNHFGKERVFRDIDSIRPGSDFAQVIEQAVARSGVVLALIGANWLNASSGNAKRRLDDPDDFVRLEIEAALKQGIVVIPVLVEGASAPSPAELPPSISRLGRTQAIELTDQRWDYDIGRLVEVLEDVLDPASTLIDLTNAGDATTVTATHGAAGRTAASAALDPRATNDTSVITRTRRAGAPHAKDGATPATPGNSPPEPGRSPLFDGSRRAVIAVAAAVLLVAMVVAITSSGGSGRVAVPGVVGKDVAAATTTLRRSGFIVRTGNVPDGSRPAGAVLSQVPAAGAEADKGATVRLTVAAAGPFPVPRVIGLSNTEARALLEQAGFVVGEVQQPDAAVPAGTVLLQSPEATAAAERGSTVTITVSTGGPPPPSATATTRGPRPATAATAKPGPVTTVTTVTNVTSTSVPGPGYTSVTTAAPLPPISTGNLVVNPGAESSGPSAPFTVGQAPAGWQRGAHQALAVAYGATGSRSGCSDAGYPSAGQLQGVGQQLFSGGYDSGGGCGLAGGSAPSLVQVISLAPYAGRTDGLGWEASVRLASYPGSGDGAELVVDVLGGGGQVLGSQTTGVVSNGSGNFAFQPKVLRGQFPAGASSVRLTLSFPVSGAFSGGFADEVSFRLG